jgi:hypothetical protein
MNENPTERKSEADAELEREIRKDRKFSMAEAIGRLAGPGMMKGVSPVTGQVQAEAEIGNFLNCHIIDAGGVLPGVLLRQVKANDQLLSHFDQPLAVLARHVQQVLASEFLLKELVRQADVEWGQVFGQRPYFEKEGCPPHPDDPYTLESVRSRLSRLLEKLKVDISKSV